MRLLIKNHFENAVDALKSNRGRTLLTIIGVTIGITSATIVLALSGGIGKIFDNQNKQGELPVSIIRSGGKKPVASVFTEASGATTVNTLSEKDVNSLNQISGIKSAPIAFLHTSLKAKNGKIDTQDATLIGSTGSLKDVAKLEIADGQFIDDAQGVVVGSQLSVDLFGTENSIGSVITVRNQPLTVVGVLKPIKTPLSYLDIDFNNSAIVPLAVGKRFTQNAAQIQQIVVTAENNSQLQNGLDEVKKVLNQNHDNEEEYRILSSSEINETKRGMVNLFSVIISIIGIISLVVGGVGIMNVMLVNVAERQREVGIRRAVGASSHTIVNQFLIEAAIIGLLGGIIGTILGIVGSLIIGAALRFSPYIYIESATLTIGLSVLVGVLAGLYPAARATRRDVVEALKY